MSNVFLVICRVSAGATPEQRVQGKDG
jgi:hypothetical protein